METININVIGWSKTPALQHRRRSFNYGNRYRLPVPQNRIPPFQISRPANGYDVASFVLVRAADGSEIDILADAQASGLEVLTGLEDEQGRKVDVIRYPSTIDLPGSYDLGYYYARISDGVNVWHSDDFCMTENTNSLIKLSWWNNTSIAYRDGVIDYSGAYRNWVYISADIAQPNYQLDRVVSTRNTVPFVERTTSYKEYRFTAIISEFLADCLRLVPVHDHVEIEYLDQVYEVDEFLYGEPSWQTGGLAAIEYTFRTGTIVTTYAQPSTPMQNRACFPVDYTALLATTSGEDLLGSDSDVSSDGGYFLFGPDEKHLSLFYVPPGGGAVQSPQFTQGDTFFAISNEKYYIASSFDGGNIHPPFISSVDAGTSTLTGYTLPGSTNEVWFRTEFGLWTKNGSYTAAEITAGVNVGDVSTWFEAQLRIFTAGCGELARSDAFQVQFSETPTELEGVGYWTIQDDNIVQ